MPCDAGLSADESLAAPNGKHRTDSRKKNAQDTDEGSCSLDTGAQVIAVDLTAYVQSE